MKKINSKGFTLIELLAVITIMGILMLVAIPAVSRTIENSRRDTYMDTAKAYVNAVKNAVAADELYVSEKPISAQPSGYYYYGFKTVGDDSSATDLMEQGGKSSWGNSDVYGCVGIKKTVNATDGRTSYKYAVQLVDDGGRGIETLVLDTALKRSDVKTSNIDVSTDVKKAAFMVATGAWPGESTAATWVQITGLG